MGIKFPIREDYTLMQRVILNDIENEISDSFAVVGGPGTGKTVLLFSAVRSVCSKNKSVLFLVYNRPLRSFIKNNIGYNSKSKFSTYHSWISSMIHEYNENLEDYSNDRYEFDWYKVRDLFLRMNLFYDVVFIDEAQDIPMELLKILQEISNRMYVFFDSNQKIDNNKSSKEEILSCLNLEEKFYDLTENHRNTIEIEQFAKIFGSNYQKNELTLKEITAKRHGSKPILYNTTSIQCIVNDILKKYIEADGKLSIGVLLPRMKNSVLKDIFKKYYDAFKEAIRTQNKLINFNAYLNGVYPPSNEFGEKNIIDFNSDGIFLMSFKGSKGLEFDYVYMIEMNNNNIALDFLQDLNSIYVASTRARNRLFISYNSVNYDIRKNSNLIIACIKAKPDLYEEVYLKEADL